MLNAFTYDSYLKNRVRSQLGIYPPQAGDKKLFFGTDFDTWLKISLQRNMISTIIKKLVNQQVPPYMPPNLVNFVPITAENGW